LVPEIVCVVADIVLAVNPPLILVVPLTSNVVTGFAWFIPINLLPKSPYIVSPIINLLPELVSPYPAESPIKILPDPSLP